jgi:hypothetical protein
MRCALVDLSTNLVVNLVIADPSVDPNPEGFILISLSDEDPVSIDWTWDGQSFTNPNPEVE